MKVIAICLGGCGDIVSSIIAEHIATYDPNVRIQQIGLSGNTDIVPEGQAGCDKILVECSCDLDVLWEIHCVQFWFSYVSHSDELDMTSERMKCVLQKLLNTTAMDDALAVWKTKNCDSDIRFCSRCIRDGKHMFSSQDVCLAMGEQVLDKYSWKVDLSKMNLEVVSIISDQHIIIGINISKNVHFLKNRFPSECNGTLSPYFKSMRRSTSNLLFRILSPCVGDVFVDLMCGDGTMLFEAALSKTKLGSIIGGDVDIECLHSISERLGSFSSISSTSIECVRWSAALVPVKSASVDAIFVDVPWGRSYKATPVQYRTKLPVIVENLARILRPGEGKGLILVQNGQHMRSCLDSKYFISVKKRNINIGGSVFSLITFQRSCIEFEQPKIGTDTWDKYEDFVCKRKTDCSLNETNEKRLRN